MNISARRQNGGSTIVTLMVLTIVGFGVYLGIQYVPQYVEARSIQSILDNMSTDQKTDPVSNAGEAREKVVRMLQINEMNGLTNSFKTTSKSGVIDIRFSYERELNLIYKIHPVRYEMSVQLKQPD